MSNERRTELYYYKKDLKSFKISLIIIFFVVTLFSVLFFEVFFLTCSLKAESNSQKSDVGYYTASFFNKSSNLSDSFEATHINNLFAKVTLDSSNKKDVLRTVSTENLKMKEEPIETVLTENLKMKENEKDLTDFLSKYESEIALQVVEIEAEGEGYKGKLAVANVLVNRLKHDKNERFPNSMKEIIFEERQFESTKSTVFGSKEISSDSKKALLNAFLGENNVGSCTYFANLDKLPKNSWFFTATTIEPVIKVGKQTFYREK